MVLKEFHFEHCFRIWKIIFLKIVVDPEGKIAKIVVGEDPAFYTYLDELFK